MPYEMYKISHFFLQKALQKPSYPFILTSRRLFFWDLLTALLHCRDCLNGFHGFCTDPLQTATDRSLVKIGTSRIPHGFRTYLFRRLGKKWGQCGEAFLLGINIGIMNYCSRFSSRIIQFLLIASRFCNIFSMLLSLS